jgi:hypothetical protein
MARIIVLVANPKLSQPAIEPAVNRSETMTRRGETRFTGRKAIYVN